MALTENTLHGGLYGWDRRNWTLVRRSDSSVTYCHLDKGDEGFPGNVAAYVRSMFIRSLEIGTLVWVLVYRASDSQMFDFLYRPLWRVGF